MVLVPKLTVDRNVIFSVSNCEPGYEFAARLFAAHNNKSITIAVSAANRVENNKSGVPIQSLDEVLQDCRLAGLIAPEILDYPLDWGMGLWENGILSQEGFDLELALHQVLFPNVPTYLANDQSAQLRKKVINAKCDVFALWGHIYFERDYFITKDDNFIKKIGDLEAIGARGICKPEQFVKSSACPSAT